MLSPRRYWNLPGIRWKGPKQKRDEGMTDSPSPQDEQSNPRKQPATESRSVLSDTPGQSRRRFLLGVGSASVLLAGCVGDDDDTADDGRPPADDEEGTGDEDTDTTDSEDQGDGDSEGETDTEDTDSTDVDDQTPEDDDSEEDVPAVWNPAQLPFYEGSYKFQMIAPDGSVDIDVISEGGDGNWEGTVTEEDGTELEMAVIDGIYYMQTPEGCFPTEAGAVGFGIGPPFDFRQWQHDLQATAQTFDEVIYHGTETRDGETFEVYEFADPEHGGGVTWYLEQGTLITRYADIGGGEELRWTLDVDVGTIEPPEGC